MVLFKEIPTTVTGTNNNILQFNVDIQDQPNFVLYHPQLSPITFTGSAGTDFDLGFTPSDNCKLLIFFEGINQSHHVTDFTVSGSTITFPTSVDPSEIFGKLMKLLYANNYLSLMSLEDRLGVRI